MLILNTPKGDKVIARGNIHTIHSDYEDGFIYITEDLKAYPFRSINGIEVKDQIHALQLVNEFSDENGETAIGLPLSDETIKASNELNAYLQEITKESRKQLKGLSLEELQKNMEQIRNRKGKH
jgi:hypothetical protein